MWSSAGSFFPTTSWFAHLNYLESGFEHKRSYFETKTNPANKLFDRLRFKVCHVQGSSFNHPIWSQQSVKLWQVDYRFHVAEYVQHSLCLYHVPRCVCFCGTVFDRPVATQSSDYRFTAHHDLWFIPFVLMRCNGSHFVLQDLLCCGFWVRTWKSPKAPHRRGSLKVRAQFLCGCQIRPYRASKHLLLCGHTRRLSYHAIHQKHKRHCFFQWMWILLVLFLLQTCPLVHQRCWQLSEMGD